MLTSAPVRFGDQPAPVNAWERLSRDAGVVGGRGHWDKLLLALSTKLEAKAVLADEDPEGARWQSEKPRSDAVRAGELRSFMLDLIDQLESGAASPQPWSSRANWAHELLDDTLGGGRRGSDRSYRSKYRGGGGREPAARSRARSQDLCGWWTVSGDRVCGCRERRQCGGTEVFLSRSGCSPHPEGRRLRRVSKDERCGFSWFETRKGASSP